MAHFNLDDYETVAERVMRLKSQHPDSRILTEVVSLNHERGEVLAKASVYLDSATPAASDYAFGVASTYPQSMRKFYVEDTITSAIGRAISLVIPTDKKPTREDMVKVQAHEQTKTLIEETKAKMSQTASTYVPIAKEDDPWTIREATPVSTVDEAVALVKDIIGGQTEKDIPHCTGCHDHKPMSWATGVSGKTKKPWGKFGCFVCKDVLWYEIAADGSWQPQKNKW
jgi:hypothetical protein